MPRNITITLEDGKTHVYQNTPDDVTPEQVTQRAQQEFGMGVVNIDGGRGKSVTPEATPEPQEEKGFIRNYIDNASLSNVPQNAANLVGGLVRGAGSIGATISTLGRMTPQQQIGSALRGQKVNAMQEDAAMRQGMDEGLSAMGVDTDSTGFAVGKIGSEIAGTAGIPVTTGKLVSEVAPRLGNAIASGGFKLGGKAATTTLGKMGEGALRTIGGAVSGAEMAGAVNPKDAKTGAVIGAIIPNAVKGVGAIGAKLGEKAANKAAAKLADKGQSFQVAKDANKLGYVIPPADLDPSMTSELASGISGKIKTAQFASYKNQAVTNNLVKKALGVADDTPLDETVLNDIRKRAGDAYNVVADVGTVTPSAKYSADLDDAIKPFLRQAKSFPNRKVNAVVDDIQSLKTDSFDAGDAIEAIKVLRSEADTAYRGGDNLAGKAYKKAAETLETAIDGQLVANGAPDDVIGAYRNARKTIAKTYTVQKALNPQTGNVDANKLASELSRGKPLEGELLEVAKIARAFPKATQALKEAPKAISPLDYGTAAITAAGTGNIAPLAMIGARPAIRSALLSKSVQNRAIKDLGKETGFAGRLLARSANNPLLEKAAKTAPVIGAQ
jgi:hypothetical protein